MVGKWIFSAKEVGMAGNCKIPNKYKNLNKEIKRVNEENEVHIIKIKLIKKKYEEVYDDMKTKSWMLL